MDRIVAWLCEEAAAGRRPAYDVPEGEGSVEDRLRREFAEARLQMIREAVHCVRVLGRGAPEGVERLAAFLDAPSDALVAEVLEAFAAWRSREVLGRLLVLYRRLERSPRARPAVAAALDRCLRAITGRSFGAARELARWIRRERLAA